MQPLASQLTRPAPPRHAVRRPRLTRLLDGILEVPVTLVTGAAGSGKTSALLEWVDAQDGPGAPLVTWTSLDRVDDDLDTFWRCVLAGIEAVKPGCTGDATGVLDDDGPTGGFIAPLLRALDGFEQDLVVVLDDLHLISDPALLAQLVQVADRLPRSVHLVAASRVDLGLPVARWAVRNEVRQVREDDLRFTPDEGAAFLARFVDGLDDDSVKVVVAQTEGWAAGLHLAALSFEGRAEPNEFARSRNPNDRVTADFLLDEVLNRQSPDVQQFLLAAAVLEPVTAELCDAVTGRTDSARLLAELEGRHLFLARVDEELSAYRFHRLFAQLLRNLLTARSPGRARELHLAAARHLQRTGDRLGSARHFVAADDLDAAWSVIAAAVRAAGDSASRRALLDADWVDAVPIEHFAEHDERMVEYAQALTIAGRYERADQLLQTIADDGPASDERTTTLVVWSTLQGHLGAARAHAEAVLARRPEAVMARRPEAVMARRREADDPESRARVLVHAARLRAITGDPRAGELAIEQLAEVAPADGHLGQVVVPSVSSFVAWTCGELGAAARLSNRAQGAELVRGADPAATATEAWLVERAVAIERDELSEAGLEELLVLARSDREFLPVAVLSWILSIEWARSHFRFDLAQDLVVEARRRLDHIDRGRGYQPHLDVCEVSVSLDRGDIDGARRVRHRLPHGWAQQVVDVRLDLASQRHASGRARIANLRPDTRRRRIQACLLAVRADAPVDDTKARTKLAEALALGRDDGFLRTYLDAGPDVVRLLRSMDHLEPTVQIQRVLARSAGQTGQPTTGGTLVEGLSDRESTVLRLLPSSLSSREIADELFISLNTLKTHLKGVYRKLDVSSRQEAVDSARRIGLL